MQYIFFKKQTSKTALDEKWHIPYLVDVAIPYGK
jgi:hypothetical protein